MRTTQGLALTSVGSTLRPWTFERRDLRAQDIAIEIAFCGVCASDLAAIASATPETVPFVPGHEFTGVVTAIGSEATRFEVGDRVAVSNIIDSCGRCERCRAGMQNYCLELPTPTYLGTDRHDGTTTQGGFSTEYVLDEGWAHPLPAGLDLAAAAPLMCAGITVWEALTHWRTRPGRQVGIVGLGGLGHLAVRYAKAMGAEVTLFTTSADKTEAAKALGADGVVVSTDSEQMRAQLDRFDLVVDTAGGEHDPSPYLRTLRLDGTMCMLGITRSVSVESSALRWGRHRLSGSGTGNPTSIGAMLDFSAEHGIVADVEVLPARDAQIALDRLARHDVRYRFVLDMHHV